MRDICYYVYIEANNKGKSMRKGKVAWFDKSSGQGMILDTKSNKTYFVHYSAIDSSEDIKTLSKGDSVRFKLYTNLYMSQVDYVKVE